MEQARRNLREQVITLGDEKKFDSIRLKEFYGRVEDSLQQLSRELLEVLYECVRRLSHKSHVYATFIGLLHNQGKQQLFVKDLFDKCFFGLQVALHTGGFFDVVALLKFFAELVNCKVLQEAEFFKTLFGILALVDQDHAVEDHEGGDSSNSKKELPPRFPAYACLSAIPYLSPAIQERNYENSIIPLLDAVAAVVPRDRNLDLLVCPIRSEDVKIESKLEFLYGMLRGKRQLERQTCIRRPLMEYEKFKKAVPFGPLPVITAMGQGGSSSSSTTGASSTLVARLRQFQVPLFVPTALAFDPGAVDFRQIKEDASHSEFAVSQAFLSAATEEAQFFLEEDYLAIIRNFDEDLVLCAQQLLKLSPLNGSHQEDVVLVFTILKLGAMLPMSAPDCSLSVVSSSISALFTLPFPALHSKALYFKLLEVVCQLQLPCEEVFGDMAVRLLLRKGLDVEVRERLADLVAWYCSQGELETRCRVLTKALELGGTSAAASRGGEGETLAEKGTREVLQRVVRISFKKEVSAILDADRRRVLLDYLPPDVDLVNPYAVAEWSKPDSNVCPPCPEYQKIHELIAIKTPNPELLEKTVLKMIGTRKSARPEENDKRVKYVVSTMERHAFLGPLAAEYIFSNGGPPRGNAGGTSAGNGAGVEQGGTTNDPSGAPGGGGSSGSSSSGARFQYPLGYSKAMNMIPTGGAAARDHMDREKWSKEELFDMLCYCFLQKGSKTPTHATKLMELHRGMFSKFALPLRFIHVALHCWQHNPVRLELAVEHMYIHKIAPAAMILGALPFASGRQVYWNVVDCLLKRILEELFFFYKQKEIPGADFAVFIPEMKEVEASYEETFLAVAARLREADDAARYAMLLRRYAGPRSNLALDFKGKIEDAQKPEWAAITEAAFSL